MPRYMDADKLLQLDYDSLLDTIENGKGEDVIPISTWTNVDDEMPEEFQNVLIFLKEYQEIKPAYLDADGYWCTDEYAYNQMEVDYWLPMPLPPKGERNA